MCKKDKHYQDNNGPPQRATSEKAKEVGAQFSKRNFLQLFQNRGTVAMQQ